MECNKGLASGPLTLPRLGSRVRIPSPAPFKLKLFLSGLETCVRPRDFGNLPETMGDSGVASQFRAERIIAIENLVADTRPASTPNGRR
jgi:hypothetical protein